MLEHYTQTPTTIEADIFFPIDEAGRIISLKNFRHHMNSLFGFDFTVGTIDESISNPYRGWINPNISKPTQCTSVSLDSSFEDEVLSGMTHKLADIPQELPGYVFYDEDDILNLDAIIATPPPHESGSINVKLIYEEPSKPIPVENPWEE